MTDREISPPPTAAFWNEQRMPLSLEDGRSVFCKVKLDNPKMLRHPSPVREGVFYPEVMVSSTRPIFEISLMVMSDTACLFSRVWDNVYGEADVLNQDYNP